MIHHSPQLSRRSVISVSVSARSHAVGLGTRKPPSATSGACSSTTSRGRQGARLVGAQGVGDVDDVRRRRDAVEVELADLLDVLEDVGQLAGDLRDLLVAELQARQARDVQDLLTVDHGSGQSRRGRRRARLGRGVGALGRVGALVLDRPPAADGQGERREQAQPGAVAQDDESLGPGWKTSARSARARRASVPAVGVRTPAATCWATGRAVAVATASHAAQPMAARARAMMTQPRLLQPLVLPPRRGQRRRAARRAGSWMPNHGRKSVTSRRRRPGGRGPLARAQPAHATAIRAACSVLRSRQAIVIGPTPPGTGVMAPATCDRLVEVDVAVEAVVGAVDADVDDGRARA